MINLVSSINNEVWEESPALLNKKILLFGVNCGACSAGFFFKNFLNKKYRKYLA